MTVAVLAPLCMICAERPVEAKARCHRCRVYFERYGFDRPADVVATSRQRGRPLKPWEGQEQPTPTLAEWAKANGYDPATREYSR